MTAEIVKLKLVDGVGNGVKIPVNRVLAGARKAGLSNVLVIGQLPDGTFHGASTEGAPDTLWVIEKFKLWLLDGCPEQEPDPV